MLIALAAWADERSSTLLLLLKLSNCLTERCYIRATGSHGWSREKENPALLVDVDEVPAFANASASFNN
jgi:hypothetical protein